MQLLSSLRNRIPSLALLLSVFASTLLTACGSGRRADGSLTIFGVLYLLFAVFAFISLIKQDWSIGKKIIWGLVIWFFPFGGSIIYFLFSGRS
ncbi:PLD nuclease N-terminal domain-containing protein [Hymenobacter sp. UYCo722]|uniref:PLD nuclease N-terminal domain-containing protein n=1 Tax=Hymenobacter sp. UYCo722 TaxID=3156335 RepID=UPI003398682B